MIDQANTAEDAFLKALQGEDELGMVIRAHIHIEHHLNELLNTVIPYPGYLKAMQLDYAGKVNLAGATGLRPDIVRPLLALGNLRNQMAHRLGTKITKSRERNFYKTFGGDGKRNIKQSYEGTRRKLRAGKGPELNELDPPDLFVLMVVSLRAALLVAKTEVEAMSGEN